VLAVAVALRHSWRRDGLTRIAKRLHVSLRPGGAVTSTHRSKRSRTGMRPRTAKPARTGNRSPANTRRRVHD
jgi:hypothetical protein